MKKLVKQNFDTPHDFVVNNVSDSASDDKTSDVRRGIYTWAWNDGECTYINHAERLEDILEEVVNYYLNEDCRNLLTFADEKSLQISFDDSVYENNFQLSAENSVNGAEQILSAIADHCDRSDSFSIAKID